MHVVVANKGIGKYNAVSVGVSATQIQASVPNASVQQSRFDRKNIFIFNNGAGPLYIGFDNQVTTANAGIIVPAGQSFSADYGENVAIWGISASGTLDVRVAEVY